MKNVKIIKKFLFPYWKAIKKIEENLYESYSIIGLQQNDFADEKSAPLFIYSLKKPNIIDSHLFLNFILMKMK